MLSVQVDNAPHAFFLPWKALEAYWRVLRRGIALAFWGKGQFVECTMRIVVLRNGPVRTVL